jgi:uncharacterized protein YcbX
MMGEELNATYIMENGLLGDRAYALVDKATGMLVSAKTLESGQSYLIFERRWQNHPRKEQSCHRLKSRFQTVR